LGYWFLDNSIIPHGTLLCHFYLAKILSFHGSAHLSGVGSFSQIVKDIAKDIIFSVFLNREVGVNTYCVNTYRQNKASFVLQISVFVL